MKHILVLVVVLLVPATCLASTRILLFEDIGPGEAVFSWNKVSGGQVALSAVVYNEHCWDQYCWDYRSTRALAGFKRDGRNVYHVGSGGDASVPCGKTRGFFRGPRFDPACRISVEPERVCLAWYGDNDCVLAVTKFRAYLTIDD
jgi:hypothetical protein